MPPDLRQLYDDHAAALYAFLLNVTRSEPEARDALQEVFCKLAARPERLHGVRDPRPFLFRLAHRLCIDTHRRRTCRVRAVEQFGAEPLALFVQAPDPDTAAFRIALTGALAELPEEQRAVVHLKLWEEMTFAAIADTLGIPANTAASRYRYGVDKLQALLRPLYEELQ